MLAILMLIVDAQIHLWNAGNPTSPWHRQIPAYLKEDALKEMDAGGVDAAILTPHTPWDPNANELCMEAARVHPDRFAILGNFPLDKPESRALVDTWKQRLLVEPEQPLLGTIRLEALPYRNVDISKFYPYGDVSFP